MTIHGNDDRLSGFAEETLPEAERAAVMEHLADCPECREAVEWLRRLRREAGELPREIEPAHDLWPAIEGRIREGSIPRAARSSDRIPSIEARAGRSGRKGGPASRWGSPFLLRAAAVVLLAGFAWGTATLVTRSDGEPHPAAAVEGAPDDPFQRFASSPEAVTEAYEPAIRELRAILDSERDRLHPGTVGILEENLRIIDEAIRDSYDALAADPADVESIRALDHIYAQKVQLLRNVAILARES
jgi:hypothetical protein